MSLSNITDDTRILVICEGVAEEVIIKKLLEEDMLVFPPERVLDITGVRSAVKVQAEYLNYDYDWPVIIMRLLDSLKENFKLGRLYKDKFSVINIYTRPEVEILQIIREGKYQKYTSGRQSTMKPSIYCVNELNMENVKTRAFLESYWDLGSLITTIKEYKRLKNLGKNELCFADLLKQ